MQLCYCTVRFIIYNTDVSERKSGERSFLKIWHWQDFKSPHMVQQDIMLSFDREINTEIFCDIKDAAYI